MPLWELKRFLDKEKNAAEEKTGAGIGDTSRLNNFVQMQRRMILNLEMTQRSILLHTFVRAGLILNLQVTQFMLHRAVMHKAVGNIEFAKLSYFSIVVSLVTTLVFDPYQLYLTCKYFVRVERAIWRFEPRATELSTDHAMDKAWKGIKHDRRTARQYMISTLLWAIVSFGLVFYAVVKLCRTMTTCAGDGWDWDKCAPVPWDCQGVSAEKACIKCISAAYRAGANVTTACPEWAP